MRRLPPVHTLPHRLLPALLAAALVLAQALALLHGVLHAGMGRTAAVPHEAPYQDALQAAGRTTGQLLDQAAAHADAHATDSSWLDALFASHARPGDCRLVDALLQGGPCTAAPAIAAAALAQQLARLAPLPTRPGEPVPFDARGPPLLR